MDRRVARALVLEAPRRLVARELAVPRIGVDDGLPRVEACGLCGTDHEQYTGALAGGFAFVPGHETVGVIEEIGTGAAERCEVERRRADIGGLAVHIAARVMSEAAPGRSCPRARSRTSSSAPTSSSTNAESTI
jgi:hypothetical protein